MKLTIYLCLLLLQLVSVVIADDFPNKLLWGDTHLHTYLSNDAYALYNHSVDPDTAYRFAKGEPVIHPYHRAKVQLHTPLDFLAVTDHAEFLGQIYRILQLGDEKLINTRLGRRMLKLKEKGDGGRAAMLFFMASVFNSIPPEERPDFSLKYILKMLYNRFFSVIEKQDKANIAMPDIGFANMRFLAMNPDLIDEMQVNTAIQSNWELIVDAADRHYAPGQFTTLIGWEYTPQPSVENLHRIVLTPADGTSAKRIFPYSATDSENPEDLWAWLKKTNAELSIDFVAIPHNSNLSKGKMFARVTNAGKPIDTRYARLRSQWETVVEVTQFKGTSETHPLLAPEDEFADFEIYKRDLSGKREPTFTEADYVRPALKIGLEFQQQLGVNPYKLGMIGSTDSHTGLASAEENNFMGKFATDSIPEKKEESFMGPPGWGWRQSASGLAAVWARENTRKEIFAAFRRREVYGTTGPRIAVRFFAGYGFEETDLNNRDLAAVGYSKGVPMGSDLSTAAQIPSFLVHAVKDPKGANLDRIQIIKSWLDAEGKAWEKIFDVAWSDERISDIEGKLPAVGDTVDRDTSRYTNNIGAPELAVVWTDPEFNPEYYAFYYVRVLQIPTPRNSLYDSVALQTRSPDGFPEIIQERAYTSPIWYTPSKKE